MVPESWINKLILLHHRDAGRSREKTMLEMGENATCNRCLAHRKKWVENIPERVRVLSRKYGEEHKEEKKAYNQ